MRWANVDFARQFVRAIPEVDKVAGYYTGPDDCTLFWFWYGFLNRLFCNLAYSLPYD